MGEEDGALPVSPLGVSFSTAQEVIYHDLNDIHKKAPGKTTGESESYTRHYNFYCNRFLVHCVELTAGYPWKGKGMGSLPPLHRLAERTMMQLIKSYLQLKDKLHLSYLQLENKVHICLSEAETSAFTLIFKLSVSLHLNTLINPCLQNTVGNKCKCTKNFGGRNVGSKWYFSYKKE